MHIVWWWQANSLVLSFAVNKSMRYRMFIRPIWKSFGIYWRISSALDARISKRMHCRRHHRRHPQIVWMTPQRVIQMRSHSSPSEQYEVISPKSVPYRGNQAFARNCPATLSSAKMCSTIPSIRWTGWVSFHICGSFIISTKMIRMPRQRSHRHVWAANVWAYSVHDLRIGHVRSDCH